jgi:hypothetical protein
MPLVGTRPATDFEHGPLIRQVAGDPWVLERVQMLQVMYEIEQSAMTSLLPPALHPTIPPTLVVTVMRVPESPVGPFVLAEAKAGCRSGARPRALSVRAYCDSAAACEVLAARWGYPVHPAAVEFAKRYDRSWATVRTGGRTVLEAHLVDPEAISGSDIQYLATLNVARIERDGAILPRLIQVDPEYRFHSADRGHPELPAFEGEAFGLPGAAVNWPVSASYAVADVSMPELRYLVDPGKPPLLAVERLQAARA